MDMIDFLMEGGMVRTSSGHKVEINDVVPHDEFPIRGTIHWLSGHESIMQWDISGYPKDRRTHYGLNIVPVIPVTTYKPLDKKLSDYKDYQDLIEQTTKN